MESSTGAYDGQVRRLAPDSESNSDLLSRPFPGRDDHGRYGLESSTRVISSSWPK